jgi:catechol 2,3-dioxygenase-like lactoylglutathione lyase family enzyme
VAELRFARPSSDLQAAARFYGELLGLPLITRFDDHAGYSGRVFGLPDERVQLELTEQDAGLAATPTHEDLLVLYFAEASAVAERAARLERAGFPAVAPENPYWEQVVRSVTVADPDGYRVVLVEPG